MNETPKISNGQFVTLLLASRLSNCLLFSSESFRGFSLRDCVLSMLLSGILSFLIFLPTLLALKGPDKGLLQLAQTVGRPLEKTISGAYILLCVFVLALDIVQFSDFAAKTMKTGLSVPVLTLALITACLLASFYGIQALGRSATLVTVFSVLCLAIFGISLLPEVSSIHFPPQTHSGMMHIWEKAITELPRTAEALSLGLLYPYVKGSRTRACLSFSGLTSLFSIMVSLISVGVLGDFSGMTQYPFYAAITAAQIGVFQRLDILVTAVWLGTFFIRFTLFSQLLLHCSETLLGKRARLPVGAIALVLFGIVAFYIQSGSYSGEWQLVTQIYWWVLGVFGVFVPIVLCILHAVRRKKHATI